MYLSNDIAKVTVEEVEQALSSKVDTVYDEQNYSDEELKSILHIQIRTGQLCRNIALYCDFCGNFTYCIVLRDKHLVIAKFNTLYMIDVISGEIQHLTFPDMGGAFRLYLLNDGYLIYGECEIVKLNFAFETEWSFSGEDIFASPDGRSGCRVFEDRIELLDFSGNRYTIPLTEDFVRQVNEKEEQYRSFKDVKENPIVLDFSSCNSWRDIHPLLKKKFGLPDYYGNNWDALWDCLRFLFDEETTVELHNFNAQEAELKEYCQPMLKVFADIHEDTPYVIFKIVS